ncbi:hypothetical protein SNE40_022469 [Patella caerulea]|uniref:C-type lectin domain-containing protein n=1 Tax=Patella caerulea TaxID=87958 RepID=A0AAN8G0R3_PATCE
MNLVIFTCNLSAFLVIATADCPEKVFKRIPLKDSLFSNYLHFYADVTVKMCAEKCVETSTCASFSYIQTGITKCYIFQDRVWPGLNQTYQQHMVTYWLLAETCPLGYTYNISLNVCYKVFTNQLQWLDAMNLCEEEGGYLYLGNTMERFQIIQNLEASYNDIVHIGGTGRDTLWSWLDGSEITNSLWYPGEPTNFEGETCAGIIYRDNIRQALDQSCTAVRKFVCEIPTRFA